MALSSQIKRFCAEKLKIAVRVRTIPCKAKWVQSWIEPERNEKRELIYKQSYPEPFRRLCLEIIYGAEFAAQQDTGGNISSYSVSMRPEEWTEAMLRYEALDTVV